MLSNVRHRLRMVATRVIPAASAATEAVSTPSSPASGGSSHRSRGRAPTALNGGAGGGVESSFHRILRTTSTWQTLFPTPRGFASASASTATEASDDRGEVDAPRPPRAPLFAAVDHREAYVEEMDGRHGRQLLLAREETVGRDYLDEDLVFGMLEEEDDEYEDGLEEDDVEGSGDYPSDDEEGDEYDDEDYDEDAETRMPSRYRADGSLKIDAEELAARSAGAPPSGEGSSDRFAVIRLAGIQHKVTVDDLVVCNKLRPVEKWAVGAVLTLTEEDVLLVGSPHVTYVGLPGVHGGASVTVMVEEITRDATVVVFKKRRRKHSRRKKGFRREVTMLRILDITFPSSKATPTQPPSSTPPPPQS